MALTLKATAGASDANCYLTLNEAIAYFEGRPGAEAWEDASTAERTKALVGATMRLEQEQYRGTRASDTQALAWPRSGVTYDGAELSDQTVPVVVQRACCEEALALLEEPERYAATGLEGFTSVDVGSLSLGIRGDQSAPMVLSPAASRLLRFVRVGGGAHSFRILPS